jgi:O-antigen/teichoic acid export membrane protein
MYYNLDTVLIRYFLDLDAVARYNAAYKLVFAFIVVRSIFTSVIFPRMSKAKYRWKEERIFLLMGGGMALSVALFSYWFAYDLLRLAYGDKYLSSSTVFIILSLTASVLWINLFFPTFFIAVKKEYFYMKVHFITATLNFGGNLILIPKFGIEGAAAATLMADVASLAIFGAAYYKHKIMGQSH